MTQAIQNVGEAKINRPPRLPAYEDEPATLVDLFKRAARKHKRPDTLNYKLNGKWLSISSEQLMMRARHIAAGFYSIGVRHGERIALLSESRVEWTLTDAGCLFAGAIDVPIYPTLTPPQVSYILRDCGARVLVLQDGAKFEELKEILSDCPEVTQVVLFDAGKVSDPGAITLEQLEAQGRQLDSDQPNLINELSAQISAADLATIIYTSWTTGEPKGVMLTHSNLISNLIDSCGHLQFG